MDEVFCQWLWRGEQRLESEPNYSVQHFQRAVTTEGYAAECTGPNEDRRRKPGQRCRVDPGGTWEHYVAGNTAADFSVVSPERRRSERRDKHAQPDAGPPAASSAPLEDFVVPVLKRPVQLEGQVRFTVLFSEILCFKKIRLLWRCVNSWPNMRLTETVMKDSGDETKESHKQRHHDFFLLLF